MTCTWKENWPVTQQHFIDWWEHRSLVLGSWRLLSDRPVREGLQAPEPVSLFDTYANPDWRAAYNHFDVARTTCAGDILPIADNDIGPGSLALYLGCEPRIAPDTVWFDPIIPDPEASGPVCFNPTNHWWQVTAASLQNSVRLSGGRYLAGCPDLVENLDILASLRGVEPLLTDLIDRPDWVTEKLHEINQAWVAVYSRVYDIIKLEDGSSTFNAFRLWGPGKTAKLQCDFSASISPRMFRKFVVPVLTEQCNWLKHSMFHLDGHQCMVHLDLLLGIENLDAIEWTPDPTIPNGGSPRWYDMYRKIIAAGKSVQAIGVKPTEILPLLDAVGGKGLMIMGEFTSEQEYERYYQLVEPYRN
jgi:hypothetical protein